MKKILSVFLSICILGSFAFSVSAANNVPSGIKLAVTETENGAEADISIVGTYDGFNSIQAIVGFDTSKLEYNTTEYEVINKWDTKNTTLGTDKNAYIIKFAALTDTESDYLTGTTRKLVTVKFTKKSDITLAQGDIKLLESTKNGRKSASNEVYCMGTKVSTLDLDYSEFNAYVAPTPSKPTISIDPDSVATGENNGIVDINIDNDSSTYSVNVTAPIGKTAVIYLNNEPQTGSSISGTATADTVIKVAYTDAADSIITYGVPMADVYGTNAGIVAFGKATIADGDSYGIKFGGLTGTYKDITDYKFPATGNADGIFAVEIADAEAGTYTAQAYVNSDFGNEITITK